MCPHRSLSLNLHRGASHHSQNVETTQRYTSGGMDK